MIEKLKRFLKALKIRLEVKVEDVWVGVFWRRKNDKEFNRFEMWVCILPMLPIHVTWDPGEAPNGLSGWCFGDDSRVWFSAHTREEAISEYINHTGLTYTEVVEEGVARVRNLFRLDYYEDGADTDNSRPFWDVVSEMSRSDIIACSDY